jgi:hypothetical protein
MKGLKLVIPFAPGIIEEPSISDVTSVFEDEKYYGGSLMDVYLAYSEIDDPKPRVYRRLWFWLRTPQQVASFYEDENGSWGYSNGKSEGEMLSVEDPGGCETEISSKFLLPKEFALTFCGEMLRDEKLTISDGWEWA